MSVLNSKSSILGGDTISIPVDCTNGSSSANRLALIDCSTLGRECFVRTMETAHPKLRVLGYGSVAEWRAAGDNCQAGAVLYNLGARRASGDAVATELRELVAEAGSTPVIVLAESADLREIIAAVDCGVRGYIPASVGVDVMVEATRLTSAGGVFLPSATVLSMRHSVEPRVEPAPKGLEESFTSRQAAVAEALRRGKANKIIAYELNMCESTVKVHIRNIMKKLKATNRTEAAFKLNSMAGAPNLAAGPA